MTHNKNETLPQIIGDILRENREKQNLSKERLAYQACLSKRQIVQLEEGGISAFYSEIHKINSAKKVAKLLNLTESQVFTDFIVQKQSNQHEVIQKKEKESQKKNRFISDFYIQNVYYIFCKYIKKYIQSKWILFLVFSFWIVIFLKKNEIISQFTGHTSNSINQIEKRNNKYLELQKTSIKNNDSITHTNTSKINLFSEKKIMCPIPDDHILETHVDLPKKSGNFVHVQAKRRQIICIEDSNGNNISKELDSGSSYTFKGKPPFTIFTNGLAYVNIFFQGKLLKYHEEKKSIKLLENRH